MSLNLQLTSLTFIVVVLTSIIYILRKGRMTIKYALPWLLACLMLLLFIFSPSLFSLFTNVLGFNLGSNMVFSGLIAMLIFINIILTVIISGQNNKIRLLIQEVSIIKNKTK